MAQPTLMRSRSEQGVDQKVRPRRVLVMFGTPHLYGMERAVLDLFENLRPEIEPLFLLTRTARRENLPVFRAVQQRKFRYTFLSDFWSWPRLAKPRSPAHFAQLLISLILGNVDALRASLRCDAMYVPSVFALLHAVLAAVSIRARGGRVVFDFHDTLDAPSPILRALHRIVTVFVVGSDFSRGTVTRWQDFIPLDRVRVIPRTIPPPRNSTTQSPTLSADRHIVFSGQVAPHKGVDVLIEAFAHVSRAYPDAHLDVIGECEDTAYEARLADLARPVTSRIMFWGYREDADDMLSGAYLVVQPSRPAICQETAGMTVLKAMSVGVPAVVFASGALPETVVDGETGLVCEPDTPESLARALILLLSSPDLRNRLSTQARRLYTQTRTPAATRTLWLTAMRAPAEV